MSKSQEWFSQNFLENLEVLREQRALQAIAERKNAQFLRKNHLLRKVATQDDTLPSFRKYTDVFGARPNVGPELIEDQLEDIKYHGKNIAALITSKLNSEVYTDKPNPKLIRLMGRTLLHRNWGYIVSAERFESPDSRVQPHGILAGTVLLENGALRNYSIGVNKSDVPSDAGLESYLTEPVIEYKISKSTSSLHPLTLEAGDRTYTEHTHNLVKFVDKYGLDTIF